MKNTNLKFLAGGNQQLNPNFVTGFADAEACFYVAFLQGTGCKTG
jgi:hypothetical protein